MTATDTVAKPRPARTAQRRRTGRALLLLTPALLVIAVFFAGGVLQAVAQSLGYQPFLPGWHWSFTAYQQIAADPAVRASLLLTARVALLSTAAAAVLGVTAALTVHRLRRGKALARALLQANLAVPHLVGALCMTLLLAQSGLLSRVAYHVGLIGDPGQFPALTGDRFGIGIIAEYTWKEAPFIAVLALAALGRGVDDLNAATRILGANRWQRLTRVTLPLLAPSVTAGTILVLAFAAGSYEVPYLLGRPYPATLPVVAFQDFTSTDLRMRPQAMAIGVVLTVLTTVLVAVYLRVTSRLARRSL